MNFSFLLYSCLLLQSLHLSFPHVFVISSLSLFCSSPSFMSLLSYLPILFFLLSSSSSNRVPSFSYIFLYYFFLHHTSSSPPLFSFSRLISHLSTLSPCLYFSLLSLLFSSFSFFHLIFLALHLTSASCQISLLSIITSFPFLFLIPSYLLSSFSFLS